MILTGRPLHAWNLQTLHSSTVPVFWVNRLTGIDVSALAPARISGSTGSFGGKDCQRRVGFRA
jgi:hypothetical protein